jgi:hypothetical protein
MPRRTLALVLTALLAVAVALGGCGSGNGSSAARSNPPSGTQQESAAALAADARSAATGDIPDNQNFLTLKEPRLRVSMLYPEGWTVKTSGSGVTISDNNNLVRISVVTGSAPTPSSVQASLAALRSSTPGLTSGTAQAISLQSGRAIKATYTTESAPNPVTGKRVKLTVDRYELGHGGRVATVDLGTPVGVDNVDAYKRMIESFRWQ